MRTIYFLFIAVSVACVISGCGPEISPELSMARQRKYGRLAIICAPKLDANPAYAPMMLKQARSMISHLRFLEKVDCLTDVSVDTSSAPPIVDLNDVSNYDALVSLVYYYDAGHVYLDFYLTDILTKEQIWYHQFDSPDPAIKERLLADGLSVPAVIKKRFYGL